jgi:hypothetical protein
MHDGCLFRDLRGGQRIAGVRLISDVIGVRLVGSYGGAAGTVSVTAASRQREQA